MKELRDILRGVDEGRWRSEAMALATIVGVQGSTYRREGARLLIYASGTIVGNISGGCLEGDVSVVAAEVMEERRPRLATYDLTADDDAVWGLGLGCNGKIDVFVEPLDSAEPHLSAIGRAMDEERSTAVAVVVKGTPAVPAGSRMIMAGPNAQTTDLPDRTASDRLRRALAAALAEGRSGRRSVPAQDGDLDVFVEVMRPPIRLVVFGAGHDAIPVVAQAVGLGWRVVVVDRRESYLNEQRFPGARFLHTPFPEAGPKVPVDDRTYALVMTHNYIHDRDVLRGLLRRDDPSPAYLGMLGPRARTEKILHELSAEGVRLNDGQRDRLYGPVGLDIGSEGPEEIAVAAIAEILAVDRSRSAGFLRQRRGAIHATI